MKSIIKLVLLLSLVSSSLFAQIIDERQIDLYFANGMFGESQENEKKTWDKYVDDLKKHNPNINQRVSPKTAYNSNLLWEPSNPILLQLSKIISGADGVLEVMFQKLAGDTISWGKTQDYLQDYIVDNDILEAVNLLSQSFNIEDLAAQIKSYKKSINSGHGVIVVAHSQGNFFTNKAYEYLAPWQKEYFQMIGVASPSSVVSGDGLRVSFDNDPVALISGITTITNQHRNITVAGLDLPSFAFHGFNYYMGTAVETNDHGTTKQVSTTQAYYAISGGILSMVEKHNSSPSQWEQKSQEFGCGCNERIYVEHKYDTSLNQLMNDVDVIAFEEELKLYPIEWKYYKGSYEGDSVKDYTEIKKTTQTLTSLQAPTNYNLKQQTTRTYS